MLQGQNIVVYDLEIKKTIEQCSRGWASHDEMGISVGCLYDYRDNRYRVYMDDNMQQLVDRLNEPETLIVAFNHVGFDNKLLRASGYNLCPDEKLSNYDMLLVSRDGAGVGPYEKGFKLDDHLKACGLPLKTGEGSLAPVMWQDGKIGAVADYCLNDVTQERALFEYMMMHCIVSCAYKSNYKIKVPAVLVELFLLSYGAWDATKEPTGVVLTPENMREKFQKVLTEQTSIGGARE